MSKTIIWATSPTIQNRLKVKKKFLLAQPTKTDKVKMFSFGIFRSIWVNFVMESMTIIKPANILNKIRSFFFSTDLFSTDHFRQKGSYISILCLLVRRHSLLIVLFNCQAEAFIRWVRSCDFNSFSSQLFFPILHSSFPFPVPVHLWKSCFPWQRSSVDSLIGIDDAAPAF